MDERRDMCMDTRKARGIASRQCVHRIPAARASHSHDAVVRPDHAPELRSHHDHDLLSMLILSGQTVVGRLSHK
jgi:hypothetical protein